MVATDLFGHSEGVLGKGILPCISLRKMPVTLSTTVQNIDYLYLIPSIGRDHVTSRSSRELQEIDFPPLAFSPKSPFSKVRANV